VPTWGERRPSGGFADLAIDPATLRRRTTIRSGPSALTVDDSKLVLRSWLRRVEIPWSDVRGIEPRFGGPSAAGRGRLIVVTRFGARDLPATKRSLADLHLLAALLEAYRRRAAGSARSSR
jgi:hypothetical protein